MGTCVHGPGTGPGNAFQTHAAVFQEAVDHLPPGHWPMGRIGENRQRPSPKWFDPDGAIR